METPKWQYGVRSDVARKSASLFWWVSVVTGWVLFLSLSKQEARARALWKWGNKVLWGSYTPESVCPSSVLIGGHLPPPSSSREKQHWSLQTETLFFQITNQAFFLFCDVETSKLRMTISSHTVRRKRQDNNKTQKKNTTSLNTQHIRSISVYFTQQRVNVLSFSF